MSEAFRVEGRTDDTQNSASTARRTETVCLSRMRKGVSDNLLIQNEFERFNLQFCWNIVTSESSRSIDE